MSNFRVGQKVAATEDLECGISKGEVFTISAIERAQFLGFDNTPQSFSLFFIEKKPRSGYGGFDPRFFRPVVKRKTDISIFKVLLTPQNEQVPA
ncbi:hypothetical protein G6L12_08225 [Agrobacterium rhizogenes]|nr:hypothetical protein [Rhizobium rhizogenes]NTF74459.1 hypothetical protein [Rhizobium rhizogenes]